MSGSKDFNSTEHRKRARPGPGPRYDEDTSSVEYYTPPDLIRAIQKASGGFFLDPASPLEGPIPWIHARHHFCEKLDDDGLSLGWEGRVWLNPPYGGGEFGDWMTKFCDHGDGLALVFNRTAAVWYQDVVFPRADAIRQIRGRLRFWQRKPGTLFGPGDMSSYGPSKSTAGAPSILIAMGEDNVRAMEAIPGVTIDLRKLRGERRDDAG